MTIKLKNGDLIQTNATYYVDYEGVLYFKKVVYTPIKRNILLTLLLGSDEITREDILEVNKNEVVYIDKTK